EDYVAAKWMIQAQMTESDYLILNANQAITATLAKTTKGTEIPFSAQTVDDGAYLKDGILYFKEQAIIAATDLGVPGSHNIENALATIAVAMLSGIADDIIAQFLSYFGGVKHRLQRVGQIKDIIVYNDSQST
ncbi:Mur ligase family protein, partial [Streptococcus pyogenes]|uniref:Mur ligase family protein n=1 Tax=Streptococcus pyogenes TaxID=1314 RepID=UPI00125B5A01